MDEICEHLSLVEHTPKPSKAPGCQQCLDMGDTWVHLRGCMSCGQIGCCDQSRNKHARKHAEGEDFAHPVARTLEPGENWAWCYRDEEGIHLHGDMHG